MASAFRTCIFACAALAAVASTTPSPASAQTTPSSAAFRRVVDHYADNDRFTGTVLVARHGRILYAGARGYADVEWRIPNSIDTKFRLGSVTKQFTAMVVLQLVHEGRLQLDETLDRALPGYRADTGRRVTIRQLLGHTAGIPNFTDLPGFLERDNRLSYTVSDFTKRFCSRDLEFSPGTRYRYSNCGYYLLGAIIERTTKLSYDRALQRRIFEPLGMRDSGYDRSTAIIPKRASGYAKTLTGFANATYQDMSVPFAAGSLYSTVGDLLRWDRALDTNRLLPAPERALMFAPGLGGYTLGWRVGLLPERDAPRKIRAQYHGGDISGFDSMIVRMPAIDATIAILDNAQQLQDVVRLRDDLVETLIGGQPELRTPIGSVMRRELLRSGSVAAVRLYRELRRDKRYAYDFAQSELDDLGGRLLDAGRAGDAETIFRLNVAAYPQASDVYVSLGEALAEEGKRAQSAASYRKALALEPGNQQAAELLRGIDR